MRKTIKRMWCKHLRAAIRHPHHYYTAMGCTAILALVHWELAAGIAFWVYAFVETITQGEV